MKLSAGTTEQSRADVRMHRIAEKMRAEYTTQIGHNHGPSEMASWQYSLTALSMLLAMLTAVRDWIGNDCLSELRRGR